jgi:hypothetical protein
MSGVTTDDPDEVVRRGWLGQLGDIAIVMAISALIGIPNYPGRINADTIGMLSSVRTDTVNDWHAPLLLEVWRVGDPVVSPGAIFLLQVVVLVGSSYGILRLFVPRYLAAGGASLLWLNPIGFSLASSFIRDTWMLVGFLGFTFVVLCGRTRPLRSRPAWEMVLLIGAAVATFFVCTASRQNAAALLLPHAWLIPRALFPRRALAAGAIGVLFLFSTPTVIYPAITAVLGVEHVHPEIPVMLTDLDEYSTRVGEMKIPAVARSPDLTLEDLEVTTVFDPDGLWWLAVGGDRLYVFLPDDPAREVREAWLDLVFGDTLAWLDIRWDLFARQIGLSGPTRNYEPGDTQPANELGLGAMAFPELEQHARQWIKIIQRNDRFVGRWASSAWIWLLLAAIASLMLRRLGLIGVSGLVSISLYTLSFFPGATDLQYRFMAPGIVLSQAVVVLATVGYLWHRVLRQPAPADGVHQLGDDDTPTQEIDPGQEHGSCRS